jgi:hypothetical protein
MNRLFTPLFFVGVIFLTWSPPAAALVTIDTVPVGNPGNANDPATGGLYGGVS